MVELLSGNGASFECFHALMKESAHHMHGAITDPAIAARLMKLNLSGHEIYMTVHLLRDGVTRNPTNDDIAAGRALFIDSDGAPRPKDWHMPPDFMLEREDDPEHSWWAFWTIGATEPFPADKIENYQRRTAAQYKTDESVIDPRRIVRLPGYVRHPANEGPSKKNKAVANTQYRLVEGAKRTSTLRQHDALLPAVLPRRAPKVKAGVSIPERCSEIWMDDALRCISPGLKRNDGWRNTIGAIIDADVFREDGTLLAYEDKVEKLRTWSIEGATYDEERFDSDCEWFLHRIGEARERAGLGTVDQLARAGGYTGCHPSHSLVAIDAAKGFVALGVASKPEGLYDGPDYASRPERKWLIENVIAEASSAFASGRSQAGKSFGELGIALSIAAGKPSWLDRPIRKEGLVLWIAGEGQERIWRDVQAWCAVSGVEPESLRGKFFILDRGTRLNTESGWKKLCEVLAYIKATIGCPPLYCVFDTRQRNMRGSVSKEEDTSEVLARIDELQQMGIAVTMVAHLGRSHDDTKGLTDWEDAADHIRIYTGTVREQSTSVEFKKIKGAVDGWSVPIGYATHHFADGATTLVAVAGKADAAVASDLGAPKPRRGSNQHTRQENATFLGILDNAVVAVLEVYRAKSWTNAELAEAVAMREELGDVSSESLKRRTLKTLREDKSRRANKLYDPGQKRWRWHSK